MDNDKKNVHSAEKSKYKWAFLKSLNQRFMWKTKRWVWITIEFSTKKLFKLIKKRILS